MSHPGPRSYLAHLLKLDNLAQNEIITRRKCPVRILFGEATMTVGTNGIFAAALNLLRK